MNRPALILCASLLARAQAPQAEVIYHRGPILTLEEAQPRAEALAVKDGRILAVGPAAAVMAHRGPRTRVVDLRGHALLPGFVDAHGHLAQTGLQAASANLLPPPDGTGASIAALQKLLRAYAQGPVARKYGIILGFGYDEAQLKEQRPPTRQELDAVSRELPVIIIHQSGHLGVLNSKALALAGLGAESKDPQGGHSRREADGRTPNGVLEETAWFLAGLKLVRPDAEGYAALLMEGQRLYARFGFTTGQDGRSDEGSNQTWIALATRKQLLLDVVSYPDLAMPFTEGLMTTPWAGRTYTNRFRVGGVKLSLDGSPQGKTAYLTQPYHVPPAGQPDSYKGYPAFTDTEVTRYVDRAYAQGWQLLVHANGDAASDQMLAAVEAATRAHGLGDRRTVMIHAQTVREDQLDTLQRLGVVPSFFGMHCYYWGDWHRESTLGPVRADRISPARSALRRGLRFTEHHDAPVAFPDAMAILDSAVNRRTRSGDILGPDQRLTVMEALRSITLWAAWQHFEEDRKGSLAVGKLADLVILSEDPTAVPTHRLRSLKVLETIKEGTAIYRAPGARSSR